MQPHLKTLEAIARVLRVRVADLIDDEPPPPKPKAGTTTYYRLMGRLRDRDQGYLRAVEKLIKAFDAGIEQAGR